MFQGRLMLIDLCPATNPMHRQRAVLPEQTRWSFQLDRISRPTMLGQCNSGPTVRWLHSQLFVQLLRIDQLWFGPIQSNCSDNLYRLMCSASQRVTVLKFLPLTCEPSVHVRCKPETTDHSSNSATDTPAHLINVIQMNCLNGLGPNLPVDQWYRSSHSPINIKQQRDTHEKLYFENLNK